jgi:hypothetical protein
MGWSWGKRHPPGAAARFHLVCLASVIAATAFTLTTIDPVTITSFAVVLGAAAVPPAGPLSSQATLTTRPVRGKGTLAPGRSLWLISPADGTRADAVPGCCRGCERSLH